MVQKQDDRALGKTRLLESPILARMFFRAGWTAKVRTRMSVAGRGEKNVHLTLAYSKTHMLIERV